MWCLKCHDVSNRALVWLAFETREVVSARRQSTDRQIEPNRPAGCKPQKFSVPPHPPFTRLSLHPWRESGQKIENVHGKGYCESVMEPEVFGRFID